MKPLFYIMRKTIKNSLKELRHKPVALIFYLLMLAAFVLMFIASFTKGKSVEHLAPITTFKAFATAGLFVLSYINIKQGIENGSTFFRLADVNFIFTSPISPKKTLLYGFLKQLYLTFLTMIFITCQLPSIKVFFGVHSTGMVIIYLAIFLFFLAMPLMGVLIYAFASQSQRIRQICTRTLKALVFLFGAGYFITLLTVKDMFKAAAAFLGNDLFNYFPVVGWFRAVLISAVSGLGSAFYLYSTLLLAAFAAMIFVLYKANTDYYEDVLAATEKMENLYQAKKEGRSVEGYYYTKIKKVRQNYLGTGALAIFSRHLMEYRKTGLFFVNSVTFFMIAWGIGAKYVFNGSIITTLFASIYLLFFFTMNGKWANDLNKPFIYLLPTSSISKIFYGTLAETIKNLVDGCAIFIAAGLMFKADILTIILSSLAYASYAALYIYGDVLSRKLFGATHSKYLAFFKMFLVGIIIIPGIAGALYCLNFLIAYLPWMRYGFYLIIILYNAIVSFLMLLASRSLFEHLEMH